jgi:hypothetical protein
MIQTTTVTHKSNHFPRKKKQKKLTKNIFKKLIETADVCHHQIKVKNKQEE